MFVKVMINRICSLEGGYCFTIAFTAKNETKKGFNVNSIFEHVKKSA